jgi:Lar family restriction alleviation protein
MTAQPTPGEVLNGESVRLLPCPFCGGDAEIVHLDDDDNEGGSCVSCTRCQASGNVEFGFKENFIENWNRRARPQPSGGQDGGGDGGVGWLWHSRGGTLKLTTWHPDTQAETAERLFTHPAPAKATGWPSREVEEALRGALEWDKARGYRMPYRVRDPIYAALDKLALFTRPEDEGAAA